MKPEDSLPYLPEPALKYCSELDESSPHSQVYFGI